MAEAKGINPKVAPEVVKEELKEMATEMAEEVKDATAEVVEKAPSLASSEMMGSVVLSYTLYAMAATLVLALICLLIGLSGNPLSYAPPPYSALH